MAAVTLLSAPLRCLPARLHDLAAPARVLPEKSRPRKHGGLGLMPNHGPLILVPSDADGLRRALARVHRRYAGVIQARRKRSGHFWQGRFGAVAMDEEHLAAALRYVSLNPVRARLVARAQDWRWSSTSAHLRGKEDGLTALAPVKDRFPRFADQLASEPEAELFARLRAAESIGRPLGNDGFIARLERLTRRALKPGKRGPKPLAPEGR